MIAILLLILSVIRANTEGSPLNNTAVEETAVRVRIIGGVEAVPHSHPYQVGLIINGTHFCGGVLISTEHVLTAAHCVFEHHSIEVILGAHNISHYEETQKVFHNPTVIIHANYSKDPLMNDIALLKLSKHVELTWAIKYIRHLADAESGDYIGHSGLLTGWGYTYHSSPHIETKLRQIYLDIVSNQKCNSYSELEGLTVLESHICTHGHDSIVGPVGACFGDSGGPLVVGNVLVGIVSFGYEICEAEYPTVYTRISYYREWITKYTGI